jgi:hypothetical protein
VVPKGSLEVWIVSGDHIPYDPKASVRLQDSQTGEVYYTRLRILTVVEHCSGNFTSSFEEDNIPIAVVVGINASLDPHLNFR